MIGGTKIGEYARTIDILQKKTSFSDKEVMFLLYFLYDSQYTHEDLGVMARQIEDNLKIRKVNL